MTIFSFILEYTILYVYLTLVICRVLSLERRGDSPASLWNSIINKKYINLS